MDANPATDNTEAVQVNTTPEKPEPTDLATKLGDTNIKNSLVFFNFKTNKTTKTRRPGFWLTLPFVSFEGIVTAASDDSTPEKAALSEKVRSYLVDLTNEAIVSAAREQINDETSPVNSQDELNLDLLTLIGLATRPPSDRRGAGIPKETWEEFGKDYVATMVAAGKTEAQAKNAAKMFLAKFGPYRAQKKVIAKLLENLDVYVATSTQVEDYADVVDFLKSKGEGYLNASEEDVLESL